MPKVDRLFETHQNFRMYFGNKEDGDYHVAGLRMSKVPIYMLEPHPDIPASVRYPMEEVAKLVGKATAKGTPYLESSIAYMLAQAILEMRPGGIQNFNGDKIGIWGVDLHCESEYAYQRPNLEYLIALARGLGIKVFIPPQSQLLTHARGVPYGYWQNT